MTPLVGLALTAPLPLRSHFTVDHPSFRRRLLFVEVKRLNQGVWSRPGKKRPLQLVEIPRH
jgi:hypothetical protein